MDQSRIEKFQRLLKVQENRLNLLRQEIAAQEKSTDTLRKECDALSSELNEISGEPGVGNIQLSSLQQIDLVMTNLQNRIKNKKNEISTAEKKLEHLSQHLQEQNRLYESWEKMIDRNVQAMTEVELSLQMKEADDLYLIHNVSRTQS